MKVVSVKGTLFLLGFFLFLVPVSVFAQEPCGNFLYNTEDEVVAVPIENCDDPFSITGFNANLEVIFAGTMLREGEDHEFLNVQGEFEITGTHPETFSTGVDLYKHVGDDYLRIELDSLDYTFTEEGTYTLVAYEDGEPILGNSPLGKIFAFFIPVAHAFPGPSLAVTFDVIEAEPESVVEEPLDPLLLQYLPILRMHPNEDYFPMNVESFVEASALWDDKGILPDEMVKAYDEEDPVTLEFLETFDDTDDLYLAFSDPVNSKSMNVGAGKEKYENLVANDTAEVTVYAYRMNDSYQDSFGREREFTVLQYWYFYAMNDWKEKGGFNDHEGDWESVFVFLDEDDEPKYVAFSAHHNDGDDSLNPSQYGSVRREWFDVEVDDNQVHSYVALGSHANYPKEGVYLAGLSLKEDVTASEGEEIQEEDFSKKIEMSSSFSWFAYEGKWGSDQIPAGQDGPQGPNFINVGGHKRFHNPIEWAGIDAIDEAETEEPATTFTFPNSGLYMDFGSTTVPEGTTFRIAPYREPIIFGITPQSTTLLPISWEIESSFPNDLFNAKVYFPIDEYFGTLEGKLNLYLFNPVSDTWEKQMSYKNESGDFIVLETTHFSRYALGVEEVEEVIVSVVTSSGGGSGSRIPKVSETELVDALITEEILNLEEKRILLGQQALVLILEYIVNIQRERNLTTEELETIDSLLEEILESLNLV